MIQTQVAKIKTSSNVNEQTTCIKSSVRYKQFCAWRLKSKEIKLNLNAKRRLKMNYKGINIYIYIYIYIYVYNFF